METEVLKAIRNRRSTRSYQEEPVSEIEFQTILEAGTQAPSVNNLQSCHFTVLQDRELISHNCLW